MCKKRLCSLVSFSCFVSVEVMLTLHVESASLSKQKGNKPPFALTDGSLLISEMCGSLGDMFYRKLGNLAHFARLGSRMLAEEGHVR